MDLNDYACTMGFKDEMIVKFDEYRNAGFTVEESKLLIIGALQEGQRNLIPICVYWIDLHIARAAEVKMP